MQSRYCGKWDVGGFFKFVSPRSLLMILDLEYATEDLEEGPDEQGPYLHEGC